jgi:hypothetical protein
LFCYSSEAPIWMDFTVKNKATPSKRCNLGVEDKMKEKE